ncbi:hypothetical protein WJX73_005678 [Symbiochloris irregularis]|uniref:Uncharacterized protein n=1 Tax=Symbiochloris irregularis TaxID=706552 RepID=A0AAW1NXZ2_9CHLO
MVEGGGGADPWRVTARARSSTPRGRAGRSATAGHSRVLNEPAEDMGRPIYVHVEEEPTLAADQECRGWRSFALRLGRTTQSLRDFEASTDATSDPADRAAHAGPLLTLTDNTGFPGNDLPGLEGEDDGGDWEALDGTPLAVRGHTRAHDARRSATPELPHIHPVTWTPIVHTSDQGPTASISSEEWQDMERAGGQGGPWRGVRLPEWSNPSPRSRRLPRRASASDQRRRHWVAATHPQPQPDSTVSMRARDVMRRELMGTTVGRRAAGDIMPSVREAWDQGRTTSALEMARHAARDLLHQLDVRIAESRARNQIAREELDANLDRASAAAHAVQHADWLDACDPPEL